MIYFVFILAAVVVVISAVYLNQFGDVISKKSSLSGAAVGTFLIAGATSLPELTTSLTAVYIDNPDIAVGNMLGSNVFNLLILASMDIIYRRQRLFQKVNNKENIPSASIGLVFLLIIIFSLWMPGSIEIFGVGIEMIVIVLLYIFSMKFISGGESEQEEEELTKDYSLKAAVIGFIIASVIVFISGSALSVSGDRMAEASGLDASFVGSFLIAASTSLPELVAVYAAFRLANYNMAIGSILGSNLFNIQLLALTDLLYREGAILTSVQSSHIFIACLGLVMTLIMIFLLIRPASMRSHWRYAAPSLLMTLIYFVASYVLF
ncbi:cation:proton antiporter [Halobacillus halophilus]|uniref:Na+/Ca2+ antiporter family protein n=1 Tax=Halobacillus halophilus (strain ATCC 35676 / DSM 2266 / JCM 20832 / KCTC 3685 / LMG 17431 / NBRC 102448 / NCIMB 2269) TaxID=866895 RepID=I0JNP7_HALH3|nr:sodium:calcium antiporter [Halobacillus halophilus]ASF39814.1 cation:proton antiporter [Halobacillus halophilus]CCG45767.1 Na+/Ca2+ antiporter family protein [Halobacillus halophilus DSM 2266]